MLQRGNFCCERTCTASRARRTFGCNQGALTALALKTKKVGAWLAFWSPVVIKKNTKKYKNTGNTTANISDLTRTSYAMHGQVNVRRLRRPREDSPVWKPCTAFRRRERALATLQRSATAQLSYARPSTRRRRSAASYPTQHVSLVPYHYYFKRRQVLLQT